MVLLAASSVPTSGAFVSRDSWACCHPPAVRIGGACQKEGSGSTSRRLRRARLHGSSWRSTYQPRSLRIRSNPPSMTKGKATADVTQDALAVEEEQLKSTSEQLAAARLAQVAVSRRIEQLSMRLTSIDDRLNPSAWRLLLSFFLGGSRHRIEEERKELVELMPGLRDMYEGWAAEVEQLKLQRARLTADIEDVVVLRGAPLVSVLRRLNLMRSAAASLVGVSDQLYQPHPTNTFGRVALADECIELWEGVVRYVVNWDRFKSTQEDKELRRGISYILASPGRGKTLYLREAMRYYYSNRWRKAQPELDQLVVMCVSFNGYVEPTPADLKAVQQTKDPRVMLYTRLVLCQLAEFGDRPDSLFRDFAAEVAADLEAGRFHHAHMEAEVERMITDRCRGRSLLLLVDEINKVGPGSGGGGVSEELGADAREILRSEGCRLASTIGEGSACYTSLERALMQAETSVSGRPGYPIGTVQLARAEDHVGMMVARLTAQQTDGGLWGSAQAVTKIFRQGQFFALLGGGHWRAAELVAGELALGPVNDIYALCKEVHLGLPSTLLVLLDSFEQVTGRKSLPVVDLSAEPMRPYVDDAFASVILQEEVQRDQPVIFTDVSFTPPSETPAPGNKTPTTPAERLFHARALTIVSALWDDFARLGIVSATGFESFVPNVVPATVVTLLRRSNMRQTLMQVALGELVDVSLSCSTGKLSEIEAVRAAIDEAIPSDGSALGSRADVVDVGKAKVKDALPSRCRTGELSTLETGFTSSDEPITSEGALLDDCADDLRKRNEATADKVRSHAIETSAWRVWERFVAHWLRVVSVARSVRSRKQAATLHELYGSCVTHSGEAPVLRSVQVKVTVARTRVVQLERSQFVDCPVSLQSLIAMYSKDELLQYVFLFPANFQAYDAVCFYEAESSIVGTLAAGDLVVLLGQAKHIGLDRVDKTGWSAVQKCVTGLEKADKVLGDKDFCAAWHQRLVYVYFSNQEFSSTKAPLTGPWAPRTVILGRDDIARLFGNLVCCLSKIIGLPLLSDKGD